MAKDFDFSVRMRRTTRVPMRVAVRVSMTDSFGSPEMFTAWTTVVNKHGARLTCKRSFDLGKEVSITCLATGKSASGTVVWSSGSQDSTGNFEFAVELFEPFNLWQIAFPPGDWLNGNKFESEAAEKAESMKELVGEKNIASDEESSFEEDLETKYAEVGNKNSGSNQAVRGEEKISPITTETPDLGENKSHDRLPELVFPSLSVPSTVAPIESSSPELLPMTFNIEISPIAEPLLPSQQAVISEPAEKPKADERKEAVSAGADGNTSEMMQPEKSSGLADISPSSPLTFELPVASTPATEIATPSVESIAPQPVSASSPSPASFSTSGSTTGGRKPESERLTDLLREFTQSAIQSNVEADSEQIISRVQSRIAAEQEKILYNLLEHSQNLLASQDAAMEARAAEFKARDERNLADSLERIAKAGSEQVSEGRKVIESAFNAALESMLSQFTAKIGATLDQSRESLRAETEKLRSESADAVSRSTEEQIARATSQISQREASFIGVAEDFEKRTASLIETSQGKLEIQIADATAAVNSTLESTRAEIDTQLLLAIENITDRERAMAVAAKELEQRMTQRLEENQRRLEAKIVEATTVVESTMASVRAEINSQVSLATQKIAEREGEITATADALEQRITQRLEENRSHMEAQMAEAAKAMVGGLTMHLLKSLNKSQQEYLTQAQHQIAMVSEQGLADVRSGIARSLREVADALGIRIQKTGSE